MKTILSIALFIALTINLTSCKKTKEKVDELTEFDINYSSDLSLPSASFTAVGQSTTATADFTTPDVATDINSKFAGANTATDKISEIKLTTFNITTTSNFNWLKSIKIYITGNGQAETQLATKLAVPASSLTSLNLDLNDINLKNYLLGSSFKLRVTTEVVVPFVSQDIKMNQTMHVKAILLN